MNSIFVKIAAALCSLLFAVAGVSESVVGYTEGKPITAEKQEYDFDNSGILIGGYYGAAGQAQYAKEAGLDFVISASVSQAMLDEYEENGVGVIAAGYNLPRYYGTVTEANAQQWLTFTGEGYKDHPALWGDDLIDEPNAPSFPALAGCVKAYRAVNPNKISLINLFPNYANDEQLGEEPTMTFAQKLPLLFTDVIDGNNEIFRKYTSDYINTIDTDYICVDIYPFNSTVDRSGNEVKSTSTCYIRNLDILAEACRETNRDFWVITQAAGETKNGTPEGSKPRYCDEVSDISQQAYACLSFGAKAIIHGLFSNMGWWDVDSHMIGSDGKPTETYYAAQKVDFDLKAFSAIYGHYTYSSTYMVNASRVAGRGRGPLMTTKAEDKAKIVSANGLLVGAFKGEKDGKAYVITNMEELNNQTTARASFFVPDGMVATVYQGGENKAFGGGHYIDLTLAPGEGVFITLQ